MIRRPSDILPPFILNEMCRISRLPGYPLLIEPGSKGSRFNFRCKPVVDSWYWSACVNGSDFMNALACICWLKEGPKIVDISEEQYQALLNIEVRLTGSQFQMPYPTILFNLPSGNIHKFVLLRYHNLSPLPTLIGASISHDNKSDIVTVVPIHDNYEIEQSFSKYGDDVSDIECVSTHNNMRVACNMALAMANFGFQADYLFPGEVKREKKFIAKGDRICKSGMTAKQRLKLQPTILTLNREVELFRRIGGRTGDGESTGREMPFHWRRGHWRMAKVGEGRSETKAVFVRPCLVRADLMKVKPEDTTTTYTS